MPWGLLERAGRRRRRADKEGSSRPGESEKNAKHRSKTASGAGSSVASDKRRHRDEGFDLSVVRMMKGQKKHEAHNFFNISMLDSYLTPALNPPSLGLEKELNRKLHCWQRPMFSWGGPVQNVLLLALTDGASNTQFTIRGAGRKSQNRCYSKCRIWTIVGDYPPSQTGREVLHRGVLPFKALSELSRHV